MNFLLFYMLPAIIMLIFIWFVVSKQITDIYGTKVIETRGGLITWITISFIPMANIIFSLLISMVILLTLTQMLLDKYGVDDALNKFWNKRL